ncbi:MAG: hypothetical protein KGH94_01645 [Candidatus Micrarchaeota archaeon]|nr:hypothetical protein [Candidatus Micrarchaeota archaeon]
MTSLTVRSLAEATKVPASEARVTVVQEGAAPILLLRRSFDERAQGLLELGAYVEREIFVPPNAVIAGKGTVVKGKVRIGEGVVLYNCKIEMSKGTLVIAPNLTLREYELAGVGDMKISSPMA